MTKHSASPFSHFALCAGLLLSTSLSACTSDDWITQECVTLARSECPAQRESQCRFHDLLKLAADTKHPKQPRITPRYAKPSRKATSNKAVITPRYDFTGDAQNQIVAQAHTLQADTAEGFDFTGDAQNQKVAQAHTLQADTAEGFDFTGDAQNQIVTLNMPEIQADTAEGFDFTGDAQNQIVAQAHTLQADTAKGFDFTSDAQNQKVALNMPEIQTDTAEGFDFTENSTFANAHPSYAPAIQSNEIANTGCIDINTADIPELMRLPGIGQARAQAIVTSRETRAFKRKKDIRRIKGIGPKSYIKLAALICDI